MLRNERVTKERKSDSILKTFAQLVA